MKNFYASHKTLIKIFISLMILAVLIMRMDIASLGVQIGNIDIKIWLLTAALIFVQILTLSYRWLLLINVQKHSITYRNALHVTLMSLIANYLFITSIGGIIVRIAMSVQSGISLIHAIAATALDRVMTLFALLILTIIFLPNLNTIASHDTVHYIVFVLALLLLGISSLSLFAFEKLRRKIIFSHRKVTMIFHYLRKIMTSPKLLLKIILTSLIGQLAYFCAAFTITHSLGFGFSWLDFITVLPLITLVASLPVGYGGWGIREGAFVFGLGLINIPIEIAFVASVQIGIISMLCALIAGVPAFMFQKTKAPLQKGFTV